MDYRLDEMIRSRLEQLQSKGSVSEFLLAWRGPPSQLEPSVTVWSSHQSEQRLSDDLRLMLGGLVPDDRISIVAE